MGIPIYILFKIIVVLQHLSMAIKEIYLSFRY